MIPETFEFIEELTHYARSLGLQVLVEIHAHYRKQIEIARQVQEWVAALEWKQDPREPTKDEILREGLAVIYAA